MKRWLARFGVVVALSVGALAPPVSLQAMQTASRRPPQTMTVYLTPIPLRASSGTGKSSGQKTVHVKEYTKKDGTKVKAHDRKAPEKTSTKAAKPATVKPAKPPKAVKQPAVARASVARDSKGRFVRSESAKHAFEVQSGYPHGRPGYVVDHIKALGCGGADAPSNMQWQTIAAAKAKDKIELAGCR